METNQPGGAAGGRPLTVENCQFGGQGDEFIKKVHGNREGISGSL